MIAAALSECKGMVLEEFRAGRDRLEDKGALVLADFFEKMGSLKVVEIPQNGIREEGMLALFRALKKNPHLLHVNIQDNYIGAEQSEDLISFVAWAQHLRTLNIGDVQISGKTAIKVM